MKINELYKSILKAAGMIVTEDGYVSAKLGSEPKPATVKGKRLVLPTPEHLRNPNWKERVVFHPLSENILRGESDVLEMFRKSLNIKLNFTTGYVALGLLRLATSPAEHAKLTPEQSEFLSYVKDADEKTITALTKIMDVTPANQSFVSIYLRRGGVLNGKTHARLGVVSFPIYEELCKDSTECYGVKLRVKDKVTLKKLFEYIIPQIEVAESHNRGSDSEIAPFLDALMKSVLTIASPLNDKIVLFSNQLPESESLMVEDEWVPTFDNLGTMLSEIRSIPMQSGNEGAGGKAKAAAQPEVPAQVNQPVFAQQPVQNTTIPAWQQHPQQQQPQYQPPQQPQPINTGHGLDFASVIRSNPVLQQQIGYGPQVQLPMNNQPRWAQPQIASYGATPMAGVYGNSMANPGWSGGGYGRAF